jgi:hypothetical protein
MVLRNKPATPALADGRYPAIFSRLMYSKYIANACGSVPEDNENSFLGTQNGNRSTR